MPCNAALTFRHLPCRKFLGLVSVVVLTSNARARKSFDDVKGGLRDNGAGSSSYTLSDTAGVKRYSASVKCSSDGYAAAYSGHIDSYITAGTHMHACPLNFCTRAVVTGDMQTRSAW